MQEHRLRVSTKGQVVIPEDIRKKYGITPGTELMLRPLDENRLVIEKVPKLSELFGVLGNFKTAEVLSKQREDELKIEHERNTELRKGIKIQ